MLEHDYIAESVLLYRDGQPISDEELVQKALEQLHSAKRAMSQPAWAGHSHLVDVLQTEILTRAKSGNQAIIEQYEIRFSEEFPPAENK